MFRNLRAEMVRRNVKQEQIAKVAKMHKCTLSRKLSCKVPFTINEAIDIGVFLKCKDLINLFKKY